MSNLVGPVATETEIRLATPAGVRVPNLRKERKRRVPYVSGLVEASS